MSDSGFADIVAESNALNANKGRLDAARMFRSMTTPDMAASVSAISDMYPTIPGSVILGGALAGVSPTDPIWQTVNDDINEQFENRWSEGGGFAPIDYLTDYVQGTYGIAKNVAQGGMIIFETLWEEGIAHPLRAGVLAYQGEVPLASVWSDSSMSSGFRAVEQFFGDPMGNLGTVAAEYANLFLPFADPFEVTTESRVNLGSGFFAKSDLIEADDQRVEMLMRQGYSQRDAMMRVTELNYGTPVSQLFREGAEAVRITGANGVSTGVSPGRLLAHATPFEPGSQPFSILSGTMDLGAQIFLDPSNVVGGWVGKARHLSRGMTLMDEAPGLIKGMRNSVLLRDVDKALDTNVGRGMLDFLSDTKDYDTIVGVLAPATKSGSVSNELVRQVANANNRADMFKVIKDATAFEIVRKPWNYSITSSLLGGSVSGQTLRGRALQQVNKRTAQYIDGAMPNYGGFQPTFRARHLESSFIYDAATGLITRQQRGRTARATGRLFSQMSGRQLSIENLQNESQTIRTLARTLDLSPDETQNALEQFVQLGNGDLEGAVRVIEGMMQPYRKKLHEAGIHKSVVDEVTSIYTNQDNMQKYFVNLVGDAEDTGTVMMLMADGQKMPIPTGHALSEMTGNFLPIPGDPRTLRRMTDFLKRTEGAVAAGREGGKARGSFFFDEEFQSRAMVKAVDGFMGSIWKPMVLLRPAWTLRVVGEENVRLAAAGLHTFNHPLRAFGVALTDKNLSLGLTTRKQLMKSDIYGDSMHLATEYQAAMSRGSGGWLDGPGGYGAANWIKVELGADDYSRWWFRELNQLQSDHVSSQIAKSLSDPDDMRTMDDIVDSFMDGDMASFRDKLRREGGSARHQQLETREGAEAYIRSLEARIHAKTGGHYEVLKEDGWWYSDRGERLRRKGEEGVEGSADFLKGAQMSPEKVRIKSRTLREHEDNLRRSGMSEDDLNRQINYLNTQGIVDDASFARMDADFRTVLMDGNLIDDADIIAQARVVEFRVTAQGNEDLVRSIGSGELGKANYSGDINGSIERAMMKELDGYAAQGFAPEFVKGVEERGTGMLDNMTEKAFGMFMGRQTNRYSRSPAFTRAYWNAMTDFADAGLIDPSTMRKLDKLLSGKGKSLTTQNVRRAMDKTENIDNELRATERMMVEMRLELDEVLEPEILDAMEDSLKKLDELGDGQTYDVGRYRRVLGDMRDDLTDLDKVLVENIRKMKQGDRRLQAEAQRLERYRQRIDKQIKSLDSIDMTGVADDLDILYDAFEKMPRGYAEGLDPTPNVAHAPSDLEEAMRAHQSEIRARDPIQMEAGTTDVFPVSGAEGVQDIPLTTVKVKAGHYTVDSSYGETLIRKTGPGKWQVVYPEKMPLPEGVTRRNIYRTKAEADAAIKGQWDTLGQDTAFKTRQTEIPPEIPRVKPIAEAPAGAPVRALPSEVFTKDELRRLRTEMNATEEQIQELARAKVSQNNEYGRLDKAREDAEAFDEFLPTRGGQMRSMEELDNMAKAIALQTTQELLYDLSKRSNFSDMMRNIFPFAEAWFEIVSTWSRLIQGNPRTLQRFQQAYKGLSEDMVLPEGATNIEGHSDGDALAPYQLDQENDGRGFFYVDPRTKQEMFAIPYLSQMLEGSGTAGAMVGGAVGGGLGGLFAGGFGAGKFGMAAGAVAGAAAGVGISQAGLVPEGESVDLGFATRGINMMSTSAIPGFGPVAAVPLSFVLDKTPDALQGPLREVMLPFGEPNISSIGDAIDSVLPSYVKKFLQAAGKGDADMQRVRANTTMEVAAMMVRSGEGSFSSQEAMKQTLDAASKKSGWLYVIRGLATFAGPTAPVFQYNTKDTNGAWFFTNTMVEKWREAVEDNDGDEVGAFNDFIGMYGVTPHTFAQGKTKTITPHALTEKAYDWQRDNQELYDQFPGTAHLLNPIDPSTDEFDFDAYTESLRSGARVALSPKQWAEKSNQLAANIVMERFSQSADAFLTASNNPKTAKLQVDEQLYDLQYQLTKEYPGYDRQITGEAAGMSPEEKYEEIGNWTDEMKETPGGEAVMMYMAAREEAQSIGRAMGKTESWWIQSTDGQAKEIRDQVMYVAAAMRAQYPAFRWAWVSLFSNELRDHRGERKAA